MRLNIIKLRNIPATASKRNHVKLRSEWKGAVDVIDVEVKAGGTAIQSATEWLESNGFNVVGWGYYTSTAYILSSTFKPFLEE